MNKYRNIKVEVDGIKFDSRKEANYYGNLKLKKKAGLIIDFELQVKYLLSVNDQLICIYIADFVVINSYGDKEVIDVKSEITRKNRAYRIKCKLMKAVYGIDIIEV